MRVNKSAACMSDDEARRLTALGGQPRPSFQPENDWFFRPVTISRILCWWCREFHSPDEVEACMALPRKTAAASANGSSGSSVPTAGPLTAHVELWAFLTMSSYEDGTKRRTGRLSLSCDVDLLGLTLIDDDNGQYAHLSGRDLQSLLDEADERLRNGSLSFKPSRYASKGKK